MTEDLYERVRTAIAETLKLSPALVTEESSAETLEEWDSLAQVNLIVTLEESLGIELDVEEFMQFTSVSSIMHYLRDKGAL